MNLTAFLLRSASLGVTIIGLGYLIDPATVLEIYGVSLQSTTEAHIVRSAYGGLFISFAILFWLGAARAQYTRPALIALLTFMAGFALGRAVSFVTDGMPHPLFIAIFAVEILYSMAAIYLMKREANVPTSDRA